MRVPSAFEANALPEAASYPAPSTPCRWDRRDYFAGLIVGDRHHAAAASAEQPMMRGVDGHGDRLLAWGGGPAPGYGRRLRVDLNHLAGVGEIRIHLAVAGGSAVFRFAAERNVRDQRPAFGSITVEECASPFNVKTRFDALS